MSNTTHVRRSAYAQLIREDAAALGFIGADARHIEAWMRVEHSTLDGLSARQFRAEVATAVACIAEAGPDQSEALALSYGL